jgi:hypothetical protein
MKSLSMKGGLALVAFILCVAYGDAQTAYTLEFNLVEGATYKQNSVADINMTMTMGQEIKISTLVNTSVDYLVTAKRKDGYTLEFKHKEMKMDINAMGQRFSIDSNTPETAATLQHPGPLLKAVIGLPVEFVITKRGNVESVRGIEKLGEAMIGAVDPSLSPQMADQLVSQVKERFSEQTMKDMFAQTYFPDKPVKIGDSWKSRTTSTSTGVVFNVDNTTTLKAVDGDTYTLECEALLSAPEGGTIKTNGIEMNVSIKGTQKADIRIDRKTGWSKQSKVIQSLEGEISMESSGLRLPLTLQSTITTTN